MEPLLIDLDANAHDYGVPGPEVRMRKRVDGFAALPHAVGEKRAGSEAAWGPAGARGRLSLGAGRRTAGALWLNPSETFVDVGTCAALEEARDEQYEAMLRSMAPGHRLLPENAAAEAAPLQQQARLTAKEQARALAAPAASRFAVPPCPLPAAMPHPRLAPTRRRRPRPPPRATRRAGSSRASREPRWSAVYST